ncbi:MAG: hypothetical protein KZQ95_10040 [Candidatus Thiodiazotropha sp. (ex Epidulcina cf. delphinae)]|nr:hypothetical protein [Candidatus Thiodiazotropha sp. (ex Epidulcina cf. delphinae)]
MLIAVSDLNAALIVDAGPDQIVAADESVQLDGSASRETDGGIAGYHWFQARGPVVTLENARAAVAGFLAPANAELEFVLRLTSESGEKATDRVVVRAEPYANQSPAADAGPDQTVSVGDTVQLDGSASTDADGAIVKYRWYQNRGPAVQLDNAQTATPSFPAPPNAELAFGLRVEDNAGAIANDNVVIRVEPNTNQPPIARAGEDQTVTAGDRVQLDGSASTDPDGSVVKYNWYQYRGPSVVLNNPRTATPSFVAPANAVLAFGLQAIDNAGAATGDNILIRTEPYTNRPPVANAGADQAVSSGDTVQLDGGASRDTDGVIAKYRWYQTRGPAVQLNGARTATPSFQAPPNAQLAFGLQVEDNAGATGWDDVVIRVEPYTNQSPVAMAGPDQTVSAGDRVQLDGGASTDGDGSIVKYDWRQTGGPAVRLQGVDATNSSFQAPPNAQLEFRLRVVDDAGAVGYDKVRVRVEPITNQAPVANAGDDRTVSLGARVTLDGSASTDADGDIARYVWWQRSGPNIQLSGWNTATPSFEATAPGDVIMRLRVEDDRGARVMDDVRITVEDDGNRPPVADAGPNGSGVEDRIYNLNGTESNDQDGDISSYLWEQITGPQATVWSGRLNSSRVSVRLPDVEQDTEVSFRLMVTDDQGLSSSDEILILVLKNLPPQPVPIPIQTVVEGSYHVMDATSLFITQPLDRIDLGSYRWRQVSGPSVILQYRQYREQVRILTPEVVSLTPLVFEVSATDRLGLVATNTITINVVNPEGLPLNVPPVADAGEDKVSISQQYIVVDGSASHDPDGKIVSYEWELIEGPEGLTGHSGFNRYNQPYPTNYMGSYPSVPGDYVIRLTVIDDRGGSSTDDVRITLQSSQETGQLPHANAGSDRIDSRYYFNHDDNRTLSGSASSDEDGAIVSYHWQQISGPKVEIANTSTVRTHFIPMPIHSYVSYRFLLTVIDDNGNQDDDEVRWGVGYKNSLPRASLVQRALIGLSGSTFQLDGTGSYDPDDYISAFNWSQQSGPGVVFLDDSVEPIVQLPELDPLSGLQRIRVELSVTDLDGAESNAPDQEYYWILHPDYNSALFDAGDDLFVRSGDQVEIAGQPLVPSDCNPITGCSDDSVALRWMLLDGPQVEITQGAGWTLGFTAPQVSDRTSLTFALAKTYSTGPFGAIVLNADPVKVNVLPLGQELTSDAGEDQRAVEKSFITLIGSGSYDPYGTIEQYHWEQLEGPQALMSAPNEAVTELALPALAAEAELLFQLTVVNDWDMQAVDTVRITVTPDLTDGDIDADGVHDDNDRFPQDPNEAYDYDADGIGDNGDADRDGDGIGNDADFHPNDPVSGPPSQISVIEPMDGADIDAGYVIVKGTVDGPANTGVTVNGIVAERSGEPYGSEFTARVPLEEGANELQVTATTLSRRQVSQTLTVNRASASPIRFFVSERNGLAPLENRLSLVNEGASPIVQVDIDYEGDGGIDETLVDDFERDLVYLYETEGFYFPTAIVTDADGLQHSLTQVVSVVTEESILAQLENHWSDMNSALTDGNLGLALEHIGMSRSEQYGRLFRYLLPKMPEIVASYSALHVNNLAMDHASVHVVRSINGENQVFTISFNQDIFGVWRIISM